MIRGHKIERRIDIKKFMDIIKNIDEAHIYTTDHTFFRLNESQRKLFKEKVIKEFILKQSPALVGIQYNKCYAVFYKYGKDLLRITLDIQPNNINIVTFYVVDYQQMPRI